jgi:hypothetical protein
MDRDGIPLIHASNPASKDKLPQFDAGTRKSHLNAIEVYLRACGQLELRIAVRCITRLWLVIEPGHNTSNACGARNQPRHRFVFPVRMVCTHHAKAGTRLTAINWFAAPPVVAAAVATSVFLC